MKAKFWILLPLISLWSLFAAAQSSKKIVYEGDDIYMQRVDGERVRKLIGNVKFVQDKVTVYCDSAIFFRTGDLVKAYSNVRIIKENTVITADRLIYEGENRMARLRDNVVYRDKDATLYTNVLDYHLDDEIAWYFSGGKLVDGDNTLTSRQGTLYSLQDLAHFYKNVVLLAPDFTLKTDTLRYKTDTKIAYSDGYTEIIDKDSTTLFAKGGEFRTEIDQSDFTSGTIETKKYVMIGDKLFFDDKNKYYKGNQNVRLVAKEKDLVVTGEDGYYDKNADIAKIYGHAVMRWLIDQDTLYLAADTLVVIESDYDSLKRILAYPNVRIFKSNVQGLADSCAYVNVDSMLYLYKEPIVWQEKSQATADTILMEVTETAIKRMQLRRNSFMISIDTMGHFNQVRGRIIDAFFTENKIDQVWVDGNAESIFYSLEKGDSVLMGMNILTCANMRLTFVDNKIVNITAFTNPEGSLIPPHELTAEVQRLGGFNWQDEIRPSFEDIFVFRELKRMPGIQKDNFSPSARTTMPTPNSGGGGGGRGGVGQGVRNMIRN